MEMDIEGRIRTKIEAILINDARNYSELKEMADEPLETDPFAEERNLYQRIINNYRNAVSEVNSLLEENVSFLSGLCRIAESIKDKRNFQEICAQIIDCILQDLGPEYCSLVFHSPQDHQIPLYFEGMRERQKFLFSHSHATLLASPELAEVVNGLIAEGADILNIGDVYREPRFNTIDFPSVVRALVCLPLTVHQKPLGAMVLSHSIPHFFTHNHTRVLKILASTIAHLWLLTAAASGQEETIALPPAPIDDGETLSIVMINFETNGSARNLLANREMIKSIRAPLASTLEGKETILFYEDTGFLILLPGTAEERLTERTVRIRQAFETWRANYGAPAEHLQLNLGYATCESGEELTRTLEVAALMMRVDEEDNDPTAAIPALPRQ